MNFPTVKAIVPQGQYENIKQLTTIAMFGIVIKKVARVVSLLKMGRGGGKR